MSKTRVTRDERGLPEYCYTESEITGRAILIKRGIEGYFELQGNEQSAEELNVQLGVTAAEVEAMTLGSMFGWHVPGADPKLHEELNKSREIVI